MDAVCQAKPRKRRREVSFAAFSHRSGSSGESRETAADSAKAMIESLGITQASQMTSEVRSKCMQAVRITKEMIQKVTPGIEPGSSVHSANGTNAIICWTALSVDFILYDVDT